MLRKLFKKTAPGPSPDQPRGSIPDGQRVYAIGDIHGRLDLLDELLGKLDADDEARGGTGETTLIFLGDLIDRGPQSAQVIGRLMDVKARHPRTRFLLGNHEEVFLLALRGRGSSGGVGALRYSVRIGGDATVLSYGVPADEFQKATFEELMEQVKARVPDAHLDFLESFEDLIVIGDYAFVHAGIQPEVPLARQKINDLRWIRDDFLKFRGQLEKIVVHGHSIANEVEMRPHRIGLDTGAYSSGILTAMGFEGADRWLVQTGTDTPST
ncbi:metallophosphoesterase family protein [Sphingomonas sp. G-3-2-10]|uniref:metallophosphoesterase family protein n=1 Tax=Sphingomonas sp. G-3-2-10 TaxID=2728838 RepID=UPI00146A3175|nr:metallophosphoesterase family protein [Sphingomonas sp. G-3-2-10]NML06259.1 serine/threonine protein phosphatase [Sphingomonas sp. G-3-2-10]